MTFDCALFIILTANEFALNSTVIDCMLYRALAVLVSYHKAQLEVGCSLICLRAVGLFLILTPCQLYPNPWSHGETQRWVIRPYSLVCWNDCLVCIFYDVLVSFTWYWIAQHLKHFHRFISIQLVCMIIGGLKWNDAMLIFLQMALRSFEHGWVSRLDRIMTNTTHWLIDRKFIHLVRPMPVKSSKNL